MHVEYILDCMCYFKKCVQSVTNWYLSASKLRTAKRVHYTKDIPVMWNANTYAQYVLNAYVAMSYCTSYMTKVDKYMKSAFRRIRKEHKRSHIDAMQMIRTLGNTLLNLQQMSAQ
jgi:hypothetical protein